MINFRPEGLYASVQVDLIGNGEHHARLALLINVATTGSRFYQGGPYLALI